MSAPVRIGLGGLTVMTTIAACAAGGSGVATPSGPARPLSRLPAAVHAVQHLRPPVPATLAQRRQIVAALDDSDFGLRGRVQDLNTQYPARLRNHVDYDRLRLKVTRIRVSLSTPQLATAAIRALNRSGRQVLPTAIVVLSRSAGAGRRKSGHWSFDIGPATSFPDSCGPAVEVGLRDLLCPSPWVVLGYRHSPRIPSGLGFTTPAGTTNIRAVRWGDVTVPGSACGGDQPIHLRHGGAYTKGVAEPWWPAIAVYGGREGHYGELGGRPVATVSVVCANNGGTADGQLGFAAVVYALKAGVLSVICVVTPRQPLSVDTPHVPILGSVTIRNGEAIANEAWYGPDDGTAGASGQARTIWKLAGGFLRPFRTIIIRKPRRA